MSKAKQKRDDRQSQALELRKLGVSVTQIAEKLGCTEEEAHELIVAGLRAIERDTPETVDNLRCLEAERLDQLLLAVAGQARKGHLGAIDRALRIMQRRASLWGLDAPRQVQVKAKHFSYEPDPELAAKVKDMTDEELKAILESGVPPD